MSARLALVARVVRGGAVFRRHLLVVGALLGRRLLVGRRLLGMRVARLLPEAMRKITANSASVRICPVVERAAELVEISQPVPITPVAFGRPPTGRLRFWTAYWTTARIVLSYLSLKLQARFRSQAAIEELARKKHLRNARRVHRTIARLQGLFIKIGQLISIMTNFLPEEFRTELEGLQDQVPPRPYAEVEQRFREEFDKLPRELFAEFDERPIASASIGQVHRATLPSGDRVAVKVQYPDIEEIVAIDLRALRRIFGVISWFVPYQGMEQLYREIRAMVLQELDFRGEADNVERIASAFTQRKGVGFPKVRRELSTARILTTEWIDGVKVSDRVRLNALGVDRSKLARAVVTAYCQQIFSDGVYHADPHPGNILVRKDATGEVSIVFIDFGAVAEVSPKMRRGIVDLIQAGIARDTPRVVQAMKEMGFIARGADAAIFDKVIDFMHQKFQEEVQLESFSLKDVKFDPQKSIENLADLRRMDVSIRDLADHFHVPKEWILLERTVLLLMGLCTDLDPDAQPGAGDSPVPRRVRARQRQGLVVVRHRLDQGRGSDGVRAAVGAAQVRAEGAARRAGDALSRHRRRTRASSMRSAIRSSTPRSASPRARSASSSTGGTSRTPPSSPSTAPASSRRCSVCRS